MADVQTKSCYLWPLTGTMLAALSFVAVTLFITSTRVVASSGESYPVAMAEEKGETSGKLPAPGLVCRLYMSVGTSQPHVNGRFL